MSDENTIYMIKKDIVEDYLLFVEALDDKFDFKDKDKFEEELFNLIETIKPDSAFDVDEIRNNFFALIGKYANINSLEENTKRARMELENING